MMYFSSDFMKVIDFGMKWAKEIHAHKKILLKRYRHQMFFPKVSFPKPPYDPEEITSYVNQIRPYLVKRRSHRTYLIAISLCTCFCVLFAYSSREMQTFTPIDDFDVMDVPKTKDSIRPKKKKGGEKKEAEEPPIMPSPILPIEKKIECVSPAAAGVGGRKVVGGLGAPAPQNTNGEALTEGGEARLLNRVARCASEGWEVEPDQRHPDLIVQELQLTGASGVTTPGENDTRENGG